MVLLVAEVLNVPNPTRAAIEPQCHLLQPLEVVAISLDMPSTGTSSVISVEIEVDETSVKIAHIDAKRNTK